MIGETIGRYQVVALLGEGGMASVYKAYDTNLDAYVALKMLKPHVLQNQLAQQMLVRFENEAKRVASLSHPNIIPILDYGKHDGAPYLVMKYMAGGCVKEKLEAARRPLPWKRAAALLAPIARALDYAHQAGLVHRDVKPANIMLNDSGEPMLTDFGIAKILVSEQTMDLTGTGFGLGTPSYMAPEQATGEQVDHRADIYSLGVVFYEMVTGRRPFLAPTPMGLMIKHATEPLPSPRQFVPELPQDVEDAITKALSKQPADRFRRMSDFAAELERIAAGLPSRAHPSEAQYTIIEPPRQNPPILNRKALLTGCLALFLTIVLLGGVASAGTMLVKAVQGGTRPTVQTIEPTVTFAVVVIDQPANIDPTLISSSSPLPTTPAPEASRDTPVPLLPASPTDEAPAPAPDTPVPHAPALGLVAYARGDRLWEIVVMDPETRGERVLSNLPDHSGVPSWSPDGESLVFQSLVEGRWQIFTTNLDGTGLQQLTFDGENFDPSWSPDNTQIAFVSSRDGDEEIYTMDITGGAQNRLTYNPGRDGDPSWSPDSAHLAFESKRAGRVDIYRMNIRQGEASVQRLTWEGSFNSTPAWSPDGNWIAYERQDAQATYDLWVMDPNGGSLRKLTNGGENLRPAWSSDSQVLAYTSNRGGYYAIWVMDTTSRQTYQLSAGQGFDPAWARRR